ncbi:hypothetical protein [Curtobacterium sp. VKM Ac-2922]|uniref:hypothetical protein n=1 Tax=Curtobacterium sp. VKM Ac-2922 TaxID=2929475 RepID=UPI001FB31222|nr:hypothetical protein [Curtobacterium sp. VKM Ac-2922]MCJ1714381.1 hypothetical protein [Curtobacterium sp. VKM Ac-2922]
MSLLATGLLVASMSLAGAQAATAATAHPDQGGVGCGPVVTKLSDVTSAGTTKTSPSGPNWSVSGVGPGTLSLTKSVAVSNSVTGNAGVSAETVSGSVGFNVTSTYTTSTGYSVAIPAGQTWVLRADAVYSVTTFHWTQTQTCNVPGGGFSKSGNGKAYKFERLQYRSYRA